MARKGEAFYDAGHARKGSYKVLLRWKEEKV